jgi:predicted nuclease of predicted toxin-antitoxin system
MAVGGDRNAISSCMKILVDMNLSPFWAEFLMMNGFNAVHWSKVGKASDPDNIIFDYTRLNKYIVFTNDLDFGSILAATNTNAPSVFQIRSQSLLPDLIGSKVVECLNQYSSFLNTGCLVTFYEQKSKVRILPLKS